MKQKLRNLIKAQIAKAFRSFGRRRTSADLHPESGQAVFEYILVLVIVLVVILGLVYQFNARFRLFAEQYFGGYIACLLETGELPGAKGATCDEEYKSFADMQAKGLLTFPNNGGSSGTKSANDAQKAAENAAKDRTPAKQETVGSGGGGGGGSSFGNSNRSGGGRATAVGRTDAPKDKSEGLGYAKGYNGRGSFNGASNGGSKIKTTYVYDNADDLDDPTKGKQPVTKTDKTTDSGRALKPRRAIEDTTKRSTASVEISESEFSFGAMIRWLIIAALILAIIIFFGGQLLQIMRSREKGGVE